MSVTIPVLSELFAEVSIEEPTRWKGLEVFPLLMERHEAEIAEISEGGSVPTIKVLNRSDHAPSSSTAPSCTARGRTAW